MLKKIIACQTDSNCKKGDYDIRDDFINLNRPISIPMTKLWTIGAGGNIPGNWLSSHKFESTGVELRQRIDVAMGNYISDNMEGFILKIDELKPIRDENITIHTRHDLGAAIDVLDQTEHISEDCDKIKILKVFINMYTINFTNQDRINGGLKQIKAHYMNVERGKDKFGFLKIGEIVEGAIKELVIENDEENAAFTWIRDWDHLGKEPGAGG